MRISSTLTTAPTDAILLLLLIAPAILLVAFRQQRTNAWSRTRILIGVFLLLIFAWSFVPASLLLCRALIEMYETVAARVFRY